MAGKHFVVDYITVKVGVVLASFSYSVPCRGHSFAKIVFDGMKRRPLYRVLCPRPAHGDKLSSIRPSGTGS